MLKVEMLEVTATRGLFWTGNKECHLNPIQVRYPAALHPAIQNDNTSGFNMQEARLSFYLLNAITELAQWGNYLCLLAFLPPQQGFPGR